MSDYATNLRKSMINQTRRFIEMVKEVQEKEDAALRKEVIRMAREAGFANIRGGLMDNGELSDYWDCWPSQLERFFLAAAAAGAAAEREACAKVCETGVDYPHPTVKGVILKNFGGSTLLAAAIRARSKA